MNGTIKSGQYQEIGPNPRYSYAKVCWVLKATYHNGKEFVHIRLGNQQQGLQFEQNGHIKDEFGLSPVVEMCHECDKYVTYMWHVS